MDQIGKTEKQSSGRASPDQIKAEWLYHYEERISLLCEDRVPTQAQRLMAWEDADAAVGRMTEL